MRMRGWRGLWGMYSRASRNIGIGTSDSQCRQHSSPFRPPPCGGGAFQPSSHCSCSTEGARGNGLARRNETKRLISVRLARRIEAYQYQCTMHEFQPSGATYDLGAFSGEHPSGQSRGMYSRAWRNIVIGTSDSQCRQHSSPFQPPPCGGGACHPRER